MTITISSEAKQENEHPTTQRLTCNNYLHRSAIIAVGRIFVPVTTGASIVYIGAIANDLSCSNSIADTHAYMLDFGIALLTAIGAKFVEITNTATKTALKDHATFPSYLKNYLKKELINTICSLKEEVSNNESKTPEEPQEEPRTIPIINVGSTGSPKIELESEPESEIGFIINSPNLRKATQTQSNEEFKINKQSNNTPPTNNNQLEHTIDIPEAENKTEEVTSPYKNNTQNNQSYTLAEFLFSYLFSSNQEEKESSPNQEEKESSINTH